MFFTLSISPEQYHRYYRGSVNSVVTRAEDGRTLRFPAEQLRPFVSHSGIHGRFRIDFDSNNKLIGLTKLD
jgi:hypothetical protein